MKVKHGDSFEAVTIYYQQFEFYAQRNNINKPTDEEDALIINLFNVEINITIKIICKKTTLVFTKIRLIDVN